MEFPAGTVTNFHVIVRLLEGLLAFTRFNLAGRMILRLYTADSTARNHRHQPRVNQMATQGVSRQQHSPSEMPVAL